MAAGGRPVPDLEGRTAQPEVMYALLLVVRPAPAGVTQVQGSSMANCGAALSSSLRSWLSDGWTGAPADPSAPVAEVEGLRH